MRQTALQTAQDCRKGGEEELQALKIALQPVVKMMVRQCVPVANGECHSGADIHTAACGGRNIHAVYGNPTLEQVLMGTAPFGGPVLEQDYPEGPQSREGTHTGEKREKCEEDAIAMNCTGLPMNPMHHLEENEESGMKK